MGDFLVDVCCRLPDQEGEIDVAVFRQLGEASCLQLLVLIGSFIHLDIYRMGNTAGHKQSRRFLEVIDYNCPT